MNWDAIGAAAEAAGAIAVVLSLIYLAKQIRNSSDATKAASAQSLLQGSSEIWSKSLFNPEARQIWQKAYSGDPLTDAEAGDAFTLAQLMLNHTQTAFILNKQGMLAPEVFEMYKTRGSAIPDLLPGFRDIWAQFKPNYTPEFQDWIDSLISNG